MGSGFNTIKREVSYMRDTLETINMMVGAELQRTQDNLEMAFLMATVYIRSNIITIKAFFKRHSKVGKEFASKDNK